MPRLATDPGASGPVPGIEIPDRPAVSRRSATIQALFEEQAIRYEAQIAISCGQRRLTYGELNASANRLANYLIAHGVSRGDLVGVCLDRSVELIVSILAILKTGSAYVPVDPAYPMDRISFVLEDAGVEKLITAGAAAERAFAGEAEIIDIGAEAAGIAGEGSENPAVAGAAADVAYVIYTSGSTGKPKGVQVSHHHVVRLFEQTEHWYRFGSQDVWTLFHSCAFDFSVWELWGPLLYGGRLVVVPYVTSREPDAFLRLLAEEQVSVLSQTPSAFKQLIQAEENAGAEPAPQLNLRFVILGGEALDLQCLRPWLSRHGDEQPAIVNMYGITETTVHTTYRRITKSDVEDAKGSVIGVPVPDLQLYILDWDLQPTVPGAAGEIYVGGEGLAYGYLRRGALTASRFVPDSFGVPGARLYRSGDLGRRLPDGEVEYLGRIDNQIKIRGFRVEPGEIEAALRLHPAVLEAVVVVREDENHAKSLNAFVVPRHRSAVDISGVCEHLRSRLPDYMVPVAFAVIDRIPLTAHGKIDRKALPDAQPLSSSADFVAPRTGTEKILAAIWAETFGVERVGIDDNFFALGGDSIRNTRAQARKKGVEFTLADLFRLQTIRKLAEAVDGAPGLPQTDSVPQDIFANCVEALPADVAAAYPLASLQAGMLVHSELNPDAAAYHDIFSWGVEAPYDSRGMRQAVRQIMARHAVLRTAFDCKEYVEPLQLVYREVDPVIVEEDLCGLEEAERNRRIGESVDAEKRRPFNWRVPPLFRILIHRVTPDSFQFTLSFHHAILDGWSVALMVTELVRSYSGIDTGNNADGAAPHFRNFIALERQASRSAAAQSFWTSQLAGAGFASLPGHAVERGGAASHVHAQPVEIASGTAERLKQLALAAGVPLKTVLLAAHVTALARLTNQGEIVTGLVSNGRPEDPGSDRALGLFLNTLPFRVQLAGKTGRELLAEIFTTENAALPHRRYPLAKIQKDKGMRSAAPGGGVFDTLFNFTHFHVYRELRAAGLIRLTHPTVFEQTGFPLVAHFSPSREGSHVHLKLLCNGELQAPERMQQVCDAYHAALERLASQPDAILCPGITSPRAEAGIRIAGPEFAARNGEALRRRLAEKLPAQMIPEAFVFLDRLPRTPNGKVDRSRLPRPEAPPAAGGDCSPRSPIEQTIAEIFGRVLRIKSPGLRENFFAMGGDSLQAIHAVMLLRDSFDVDLPLRAIFETPTVAEVALSIVRMQAEKVPTDELARLLTEIERMSDGEAGELLSVDATGGSSRHC